MKVMHARACKGKKPVKLEHFYYIKDFAKKVKAIKKDSPVKQPQPKT